MRPTVRWFAQAAVLVLAVLVAACAGKDKEEIVRIDPVDVHVTNNNWNEVVIFAIRGGSRHRLGEVRTDQTRRFRVPPGLLDPGRSLRLVADPVGANRTVATPRLVVGPGQSAYWLVANNLRLSHAEVY